VLIKSKAFLSAVSARKNIKKEQKKKKSRQAPARRRHLQRKRFFVERKGDRLLTPARERIVMGKSGSVGKEG